jgi:AhpD family alkylhydroperoxidase
MNFRRGALETKLMSKSIKSTKPAGLPPVLQEFAARYPEVWDAYDALGGATMQAGPLDEKTRHLVKLGIAIATERQGVVHAHARRALKAGASEAELMHVGILAITTIGWSGAFAAITWIQDVLPGGSKPIKPKKKKAD